MVNPSSSVCFLSSDYPPCHPSSIPLPYSSFHPSLHSHQSYPYPFHPIIHTSLPPFPIIYPLTQLTPSSSHPSIHSLHKFPSHPPDQFIPSFSSLIYCFHAPLAFRYSLGLLVGFDKTMPERQSPHTELPPSSSSSSSSHYSSIPDSHPSPAHSSSTSILTFPKISLSFIVEAWSLLVQCDLFSETTHASPTLPI